MRRRPPRSTLFPYTPLFRSLRDRVPLAVRKSFHESGFVDVETPILTRSTPGGARQNRRFHVDEAALVEGLAHRQRDPVAERSEERRVGKEGRSRWSPSH